jgi:phenylacetate-CoA ligase
MRKENIYLALPVSLQNLVVAIEGYRLFKLRYGKGEKKYFEELKKSQYLSRGELENLQLERLKTIVKHAHDNVPYYKDKFKNLPEIKSLDDLLSYPVLEKNAVRQNTDAFYNPALHPSERVILHTSGTTGTPLVIKHNRSTIEYAYALQERQRLWAGTSLEDRRATFGGRVIMKSESNKPPFWRHNPAFNQILFSSYHMSEKNLPHYARELARFNPVEIYGYPSSLNTLALFLKAHPEYKVHPKTVLTNSEPLYEYQEENMKEAFGCGIFEWYGSVEYACFAGRCEHGNLHIASEFGIIEILDENNHPCPSGIEGEIACTGFMTFGMPFIRYKLGDTGIISGRQCACGRALPVIDRIGGRADDIIRTPDGRPVGRMDPVFKGLVGIHEAQIIQDKIDHVLFRIVPAHGYSQKTKLELIENAKQRLGDKVRIDVEEVPKIERGPQNKFRAVISKITNQSV